MLDIFMFRYIHSPLVGQVPNCLKWR